MVEVKRYAIFFNGSLGLNDYVAAHDRTTARALITRFLGAQKFDGVYRLDDECEMCDMPGGDACYTPTMDSLQRVIKELKETRKVGEDEYVFTFVNGHGEVGYLSRDVTKADFAKALNELPESVSRVTIAHQCLSGALVNFKLVDENDLLWTYGGPNEPNITDGAGIIIALEEVNEGDISTASLQDLFWMSRRQIYEGKFMPYYRRFVFLKGPNFVDRGFTKEPAPPPFPAELVEVEDIAEYLELTEKGKPKGVTVIGFEGGDKEDSLKMKLAAAAKRHKGFVQFIWIPKEMARDARPEGAPAGESVFQLFFYGGDKEQFFRHDRDVDDILRRLHSGEEIK